MQCELDTPNPVDIDDEVFGSINLLTKSLRDLDDRGLVLSLAAFAEEALGDLLKAFLIPSQETFELIDGFNAPLGTFSSRIKAAYSIGLVTKDQFQALERLRKIRNEYAHSWKPVDLSKQKIAALINGMKFSNIDDRYPDTSKEKIRSSMSCLLNELSSSTHQIKKKGMQAKVIGNSLMCGFSGDFDEQIQNARQELNNIVKNWDEAEGSKKAFYLNLLLRLTNRFKVLAKPESVEQKKNFISLIEDLTKALHKVST